MAMNMPRVPKRRNDRITQVFTPNRINLDDMGREKYELIQCSPDCEV
ncbi:MAG: hypothetical protein QOH70_1823 [Blastocatellia bacterium]|jgi:hypothetical protein|nr:hypothetical protein [Blastocatellia bacterium]